MSKYIYTTIYEQFTGLKPPEPKDHKPRRRRGYGHPYRMRLNMQEGSVQDNEMVSDRDSDKDFHEQAPVSSVFHPGVNKQSVRRFSSSPQGYCGGANTSMTSNMNYMGLIPEDPCNSSEPKVTYKKSRRQYGYTKFNVGPMGRDKKDNTDY